MLLSKRAAVCNGKISKFLKEQEAQGLWDSFKDPSNPFMRWQ